MMMTDPLYPEDAFIFGNRKKRKARREKRRKRKASRMADPKFIARKQRQKALGRKLGQAYQDIGGASAIGRAVDRLTRPAYTNPAQSSGGISSPLLTDPSIADSSQKAKAIPTLVYVLGSVLIIGSIGLLILKTRKRT